MKHYFAKKDSWFDEGSEAKLIAIIYKTTSGLFRGIKNGEEDEEICTFDEFDIIEEVV